MNKMVTILVALTLLSLQAKSEHLSYLSQLALMTKNPKGPDRHFYTKIYEELFQDLKDKPLNILEIQAESNEPGPKIESETQSTRQMWDAYFSHQQTQLHFIDQQKISSSHLKKLSPRCCLHLINQFNQKELASLGQKMNFDLIIDSGALSIRRQVESFNALLPALKPGGIYIIENLFSSYLAPYNQYEGYRAGIGSPQKPQTPSYSTVRFLQSLVDYINKGPAQSPFQHAPIQQWPNQVKNNLNYYEREIESVHFYSNLCVITKRKAFSDITATESYKPIPFQYSISESKIVQNIPKKDRDFALIIPGKPETYIYSKEKDYYDDYQRSLYAITQAKTGWDCLRHYEILANGCIPYFLDLDKCHPNAMFFLPKDLIKEAMNLPGVSYLKIDHTKFNRAKYDELLNKILEHTKKHLSSKAMAEYLLKSVNYKGSGSVLYLTGNYFPSEYMRDLTLIGLKEYLHDRVIDYPKVPHIYKNYDGPKNNLYGKGFTYTNIATDYPIDRNSIEERIKNREFDLIIYSVIHMNLPLYELVCKHYKPEEVIYICGGEDQSSTPGGRHICSYLGLFPYLFLREWSFDVTYP